MDFQHKAIVATIGLAGSALILLGFLLFKKNEPQVSIKKASEWRYVKYEPHDTFNPSVVDIRNKDCVLRFFESGEVFFICPDTTIRMLDGEYGQRAHWLVGSVLDSMLVRDEKQE